MSTPAKTPSGEIPVNVRQAMVNSTRSAPKEAEVWDDQYGEGTIRKIRQRAKKRVKKTRNGTLREPLDEVVNVQANKRGRKKGQKDSVKRRSRRGREALVEKDTNEKVDSGTLDVKRMEKDPKNNKPTSSPHRQSPSPKTQANLDAKTESPQLIHKTPLRRSTNTDAKNSDIEFHGALFLPQPPIKNSYIPYHHAPSSSSTLYTMEIRWSTPPAQRTASSSSACSVIRIQVPPEWASNKSPDNDEKHKLLHENIYPMTRSNWKHSVMDIGGAITMEMQETCSGAPVHEPGFYLKVGDGDENERGAGHDASTLCTVTGNQDSQEMQEDATSFLDIALPHLPGSDLPPIYDTCTQVRTKIKKLLEDKHPSQKDAVPCEFRKDGSPKPWTIRKFCDTIGDVNSNSYGRFMKARGTMGGCEGAVYSGAYIFFEKKRIWEGGKETETRKKCERENPRGLAVRDTSGQKRVTKAIGNRGSGRKMKRQWKAKR